MKPSDTIPLSLDEATTLVDRILSHAGFSPARVRALTHTIDAGERDGCCPAWVVPHSGLRGDAAQRQGHRNREYAGIA